MAEVITDGGAETLKEFLDSDEELPDVEPAEPRWKKAKDQWEWEDEPRSFTSKAQAIFPEGNHTRFRICRCSSCLTCSLMMTCSSWSPPSPTSTPSPSLGARPPSQVRTSECFWPSFFSLATTKSPTTSSIGPTRKTLRTRWSRMPCPGTGSCRSSAAFTWVRTWSWRATGGFIFIQLFSLFSTTYEKMWWGTRFW